MLENKDINERFFSQDNFDMLDMILCSSLKRKSSLDLHIELPQYKHALFKFMGETFDNADNSEMSLEGLNKECLKFTLQKVLIDIESNNKKSIEKENDINDMATPINALIVDNHEDLIEEANPELINIDRNDEMVTPIEELIVSETEIQELREENTEKIESEFIEREITVNLNSRDRLNYEKNDYTNLNAYSFSVTLGGDSELDGIKTQDFIKNITKVKLNHIIVPNVNNNLGRFPYVHLNIKEFPNKFIGTSDHLNNSFAMCLKDKNWGESTASNIDFQVMLDKHSTGWIPETPISTINRLTFEIRNPYGELINSEPDFLDLNNASLIYNNGVLEIEFSNYFSINQFNQDHKIHFKNVSLNLNNPELVSFLESNNGHIISSVDIQGENSNFFKQIKIATSYSIDYATGDYIYDNFDNFSSANYVSGYILNTSKQTNISLQFTTRKYKMFQSEII